MYNIGCVQEKTKRKTADSHKAILYCYLPLITLSKRNEKIRENTNIDGYFDSDTGYVMLFIRFTLNTYDILSSWIRHAKTKRN